MKKDFVNEVNDVETNIIIINLKNHSDKVKLIEYFSKNNITQTIENICNETEECDGQVFGID